MIGNEAERENKLWAHRGSSFTGNTPDYIFGALVACLPPRFFPGSGIVVGNTQMGRSHSSGCSTFSYYSSLEVASAYDSALHTSLRKGCAFVFLQA